MSVAQISKQDSFEIPIFDVMTSEHLTATNVPELLLEAGETYYWRTQHIDEYNNESEWSDISVFSCQINSDDTNNNGIPDDQEVKNDADLNKDSIPDHMQNIIKSAFSDIGNVQIGLCKESSTVNSINAIKVNNPSIISDMRNRPESIPYGLISFKLTVNNPGDIATVTVYFSKAAPNGSKWYKYDSVNGWQDYSSYATFNPDRTSVALNLKDGGYGDNDGTENGIIIDPSGIGTSSSGGDSSSGRSFSSDDGGGGGGGCFIATVAFGSPIEKNVKILKDFRDYYLLSMKFGNSLIRLYNKYSPHLAHFISKYEILKTAVRFMLYPVVVIAYVMVYTTFIQQLMLLWVILIIITIIIRKRLKFE